MQDACRGPYSVDSRKLLGWAAQQSAEACRGSVVPIPVSIAITVIPFLPAKPLARGEKRSVLPCILFPLRKFVFRHLFAEKEPSCDKGNTQKTESSRAMRPRHSFLLRWRRFINAPGQALPGPSPGRAGHRTPGCSCVSFGTGSGGATDSPAAQQLYR